MLDDLVVYLDLIECDVEIGVVMLIVEGDKVFCIGVDINVWGDFNLIEFVWFWVCDGYWIFDCLVCFFKFIIVVLNGYVFGGGFELVVVCDICVMVFKVFLVFFEVGVGIVSGWFGI